MKIYCISIYNQNYKFFKKNNLIPVGLGKKKFSSKWFDDKHKKNISSKNENFGEYTFHYSLWKNGLLNKKNSNWTGFCTYRRFWVKKNYKEPKSLKDLNKIILKKVPKEWKGYDTVLPRPLKLGKLKVMKLLKNNFIEVVKKPSLLVKKCTIKDHFNLFHGDFFLSEAMNLLEPNERIDFEKFLQKYEFNPHNIFICKKHSLIQRYYKDVFSWLFKCEKNFRNMKLDTYGKKRIYGFLAERYMPFWFKKNSKTINWPFVFFDTNENKRF